MKAISPVRSVRSCYKAVCCISEQSLAIHRNKHACEDEPPGGDPAARHRLHLRPADRAGGGGPVRAGDGSVDKDCRHHAQFLQRRGSVVPLGFTHCGAGKHMSPLHSGQEDKRGRKGWDRYLG
ncbi:hypothetical protein OJAV_G00215290 [Oryzias javanicus]|uniref:Uncharacterized protein n=1 Tax=Oryzias javanicus TaxID=123683 RepID=A0A3S2NVA8_ORYJA|nr:hypothetical protein OJAV_G00215290 [Oryzias javanicus]